MKSSKDLLRAYIDILSEQTPPNVSQATGVAPQTPTGATTVGTNQNVTQDPQAVAKMAAQQAVDRQNRRKELQDRITAKQQDITNAQKELQDLRTQLVQIK